MCPYELALKLHELGVNSESEFYFVKEMKGGGSKTESVTQNTMRYSYRKEGDLIPAYMSHELGEILPSMINISKSKIWDDWLQLTQYFPNKDIEYYEAAYVRYDTYNNLSLYMNGASRSSGEKNLHAMNSLFDFVFNQDEYAFPIQKLMEFKKKSNEFWANRIDNLLKYYKDNHVVLMEKDFEYTILMDEPDRNLDIDNIMDLYKVLSFHKPQTQIIAVIHNPALIYKLSKLDCVNFIEMTKGYLKKITGFMNKK